MMLTYRQLAKEIEKLTDEQKNCNVAIFVPWDDEYVPVDDGLWFADYDNDVLDQDYPIIHLLSDRIMKP